MCEFVVVQSPVVSRSRKCEVEWMHDGTDADHVEFLYYACFVCTQLRSAMSF